jgi:hypothetical protein
MAEQSGARCSRWHPFRISAPILTRTTADVERLWPLSNEAIANRHFETSDELQEAQAERCVALQNDLTGIRQATLFHWCPPSFSSKEATTSNPTLQ